jgi:hypothetical protein
LTALWAAAADLDTSTLFGGFGLDPASGTQVKHEMTLVRRRTATLPRTPIRSQRLGWVA